MQQATSHINKSSGIVVIGEKNHKRSPFSVPPVALSQQSLVVRQARWLKSNLTHLRSNVLIRNVAFVPGVLAPRKESESMCNLKYFLK